MNYSHTLLIPEKPKSEVVHERKSIKQIPFNTCLDDYIGQASDFK